MLQNNSKIIIAFISTLFILSSFWLFRVSDQYNDPNYQKNWWAIEFSDPKSNNLNFVLENHSDRTDFHYELLDEENKISEKDFRIEKGEVKEIKIGENFGNKKITVRVVSGDEKREIYKNL